MKTKTFISSFRNRKYGLGFSINPKRNFLFLLLAALFAVPTMNSAQKLTDPALDFTLFIKDDLILKKQEIEGRVAVGGNLVIAGGNYQISPREKDDATAFRVDGVAIGLAVRGGVSFDEPGELKINSKNYVKIGNPSHPNALKAHYIDGGFRIGYTNGQGGSIKLNTNPGGFSNPPVSESNNPVFENVFGVGAGKIDIEGAFAKFEKTSRELNELPNNVSVTNFDDRSKVIDGPFKEGDRLPGKPLFILDPEAINVLTIPNSLWLGFREDIRFQGISQNPHPNFGLIINITHADGDVWFGGMPDLQNFKGHVVYNFPDATSDLRINGKGQIDGVILAPKAKVIKQNPGNLVGQVIARSFEHDGDEIHYEPLKPDWIEKAIDVAVKTFCLLDAPYLEYEVTGNFDTKGLTATIEWLTPEGKVVKKLENQPLAGRILFPGAAVDGNGNGVAWPGWKVIDGKWEFIEDENSELRKPGSKIRVTVNPIFLADISYPQSSEECFTNPPPTDTPPLPVRLVSFNVTDEETGIVALKWRVADAENFSHFEVEKSRDGRAFTFVKAIDFTEERESYSFVDGAPYTRVNYYRLKLVDLDGSYTYSQVEAIQTDYVTSQAYSYPNPFVSTVTIVSGAKQTAIVYDITGRVVGRLLLEEGKNEVNGTTWPSGINLIRTEDGKTVKAIKN